MNQMAQPRGPVPLQRAVEVFVQGPLHIGHLEGQGDTLVLSFAGVGRPEEAVQGVEAARLAGEGGKNHVMFIADASRSWMNGPGIMDGVKTALDMLRARIQPRRVIAVGNSMGGSSALIFAGAHRVDAVLALAPQFSVCPDVAPWETRWQHYTKDVAEWRYPTCPDLSGSDTQVTILHGRDQEERRHAMMFKDGPRIAHFLMGRYNHRMSQKLKKRGLLQPIFSAFIAGDLPATHAAIMAAGGQSLADYHQSRRAAKAAKLKGLENDPI
jgi:pimeloyl-ACP methyl ester carboxylesterase